MLLLLALALSPGQSEPASRLHVQDAAGRAIVQATARCGTRTARADPAGDIALACAGPLLLQADGFRSVTVAAGTSLIILAPAEVTAAVTSVTGADSLPVGEAARTVYTLSAAELHAYPALTLDETLRQHAGFELFRRAPSRVANPTSEGISLRGLGSTAVSRTLVLEDGAPLNDPFGGWIHWNENPAQAVQTVELVTGGGSDLYGSSALGGVIDITPVSPIRPTLALEASAGAQDTSDFQGTSSFASQAMNGLLAGESLRTAGYIVVAPGLAGPIDTPANVRSQAYHAELGRRQESQDAGFARDPRSHAFLTGNVLNEDRNNGTPLQTNATRLWRYLAGYDVPAGERTEARLRLFGSDEGYRQTFTSTNAARTAETLTRLQRVHTQELGGTLNVAIHFSHFALLAGTDVRDLRGIDSEVPIAANTPNGLQDVTARQRYVGGFAELLESAGKWSGAISLRLDHSANLDTQTFAQARAGAAITAAPQPDRAELIASPRLGITRALGATSSAHVSAFRAFRAASMNELYRTGQVGQQTTLANPALNSERATGVEAGLESAPSPRISFKTTYFWTVINRPVSAVLLSQTATSSTSMRENLGQLVSQGVEAAADFHLTRVLSATAGYQFANAVVTRFAPQPALVGLRIPQVPQHSLTGQVRLASARQGELTLAVRGSSLAFDDANNQFPLASFVQLDVYGRRSLVPRRTGGRLDAFFLIQNLTGQRQQVARTPILTLGSPVFAEAGLRFRLGRPDSSPAF